MISAIAQFHPDALLVYGWNFDGHWATMRHFKSRVPVWFRGDSTLIDPLPFWKKALRKLLLTQVYRSVDRAFYVGKANKRYFLWAGLHESQLNYAPHAVDNDYFMRDDEARMEMAAAKRRELGIDPDATVFLFVGKLEAIKQPEMLGRAFARIKSTNAHLIYIGSGAMDEALKSEFSTLPNIHFVGFKNQQSMPIWYRVGDVLCLPSITETWGLAVNEAMACGCTAIVSNRVGCVEEFEKITPDSIQVFDWNDEKALIKCLMNCIDRQVSRQIDSPDNRFNSHFNFLKFQAALSAAMNDSAVGSMR